MVLEGAYKLSATAKLAPTLTEVIVYTVLLQMPHAMNISNVKLNTCRQLGFINYFAITGQRNKIHQLFVGPQTRATTEEFGSNIICDKNPDGQPVPHSTRCHPR